MKKSVQKKVTNLLKKAKELLDDEVNDRTCIYDDRSEKWQDSEKGDSFYVETEEIEGVVTEIENAIEELGNIGE